MRAVLLRPVFKWSLTEGLERLDQHMPSQKLFSKPTDALGHIKSVQVPVKLQKLSAKLEISLPLRPEMDKIVREEARLWTQ